MHQFLALLRQVRSHFTLEEDCTATGPLNFFGYQMRINLEQGFPLVTTKKLHLRSIIHELLCHGGSNGDVMLNFYYGESA